MPFPTNISKDHLLKAIEKIDNEGIPGDAESQYYDVVLPNGKRYPPKVVVSFANIFANGVELDRAIFSGGLGTPCFKLLEQHGFTIEKKNKNMYYILKVVIDDTVIQDKVAATTYVDAFNLLYERGLINESIVNDFNFVKNNKADFSPSEQRHDGMLFLIKGSKDLWISTYNETERKHDFLKRVFDKYNINGSVEMIEVNGEANNNDNLNTAAVNKIKIYDIKLSASANSHELLSPDGKYFYWNNEQFKGNEIGDKIFFIDRNQRWALCTEIKVLDINTTYNSQSNTSTFNHQYNTYPVSGEYNTFIRFDIIQKVQIPQGWNYTKQLGQSEVYDLYKPGVALSNPEDRRQKIDDLEKIFTEGEAYEMLEEARNNLNQSLTLNPDIVAAINTPEIQAIINAEEFTLQLGKDKWEEVKAYKEPATGFLQNVLDSFVAAKQGFTSYLNTLPVDGEEYKILLLLAKLYSYCDTNAANKAVLNEYEDKKVIGKTNIPQNEWIVNLLKFKISGGDPTVCSQSIQHILAYLEDPLTGITIVSIHHRKMVAKYLLKLPFDEAAFVGELIDYFKPYGIVPRNPLNLTRIIGNLLYGYPRVKKLWFERLGGLVVCDNTGWIQDAIDQSPSYKYMALWWDKSPSGGGKVVNLLRDAIQNSDEHSFYIYYTINQKAVYRSRIIDFAFEEDYPGKNWNKENNVGWYQPDFAAYSGKNSRGNDKKARVVFLADEIVKLKEPIEMKYFDFYAGHVAPTQNNMQPYTELFVDAEIEDTPPIKKENAMLPKDIITHVTNYMSGVGFQYQEEEIANFYLSLKAKPFVILAGISGTGKSQLPRQFAKAIGMEREQVILVPVRPDWTDGSDLLGYTGLDNKFKPKDLTIAIIEAHRNPGKPFFFILDEMNLARVEHYFSDFLSVIETREWSESKTDILTDPMLRKETLQAADNANEFRDLKWPKNLFLIGTVNMDETTHAFSRKVLDRANSIEMNDIDLSWATPLSQEVEPLTDIANSFFQTEYLSSIDLTDSDKDEIKAEIGLLKDVNAILQKADLHFAYRVRDEVAFYLLLNKRFGLMAPSIAMDFQLVQKVLPRIHGSSERIQTVLIELLNLLENKSFSTTNFDINELNEKLKEDDLKYKRSSRKIVFMLRRFEDDRFTSFWL